MRITKLSLFFSITLCTFLFCVFQLSAQTQEKPSWKIKLEEKNVKYENFACQKENAETVANYFKKRQVKSFLPICHNDCPIIKCKPVIYYPTAAKTFNVKGTVSIHILVNEKGRTVYARPLSGHPLLWSTIKKAACDTQFREKEHLHQGVMHFVIDSYDFIEVPNRANEVS